MHFMAAAVRARNPWQACRPHSTALLPTHLAKRAGGVRKVQQDVTGQLLWSLLLLLLVLAASSASSGSVSSPSRASSGGGCTAASCRAAAARPRFCHFVVAGCAGRPVSCGSSGSGSNLLLRCLLGFVLQLPLICNGDGHGSGKPMRGQLEERVASLLTSRARTSRPATREGKAANRHCA